MRWQHFDELEADFQQYYQLDVAYVKPARAARLLFQLPRGCRLFTALVPANQWGWSEVLQNKITYLLEVLIWQNANEGVKKSKQTAKPKPFEPAFMKKPSELNRGSEAHATETVRSILDMPRG